MPDLNRVEILGVPVDCVDMESAVAVVDAMVRSEHCQLVVAVNPEKVMAAQRDPRLLSTLQTAALLIPDGIGVVIAARLLTSARIRRVAGADLMPAVCELAAQRCYGVYLYGARPETNLAAAAALRRRFPALQIVGRTHGFEPEERMEEVVEAINRSGAQILFVALGSPKQEYWMSRHLSRLRVKVCQGVGGTLDVLSGTVKRAPEGFRLANLEWLYRLLSEPSRAGRQIVLPRFALAVMKKRFLPPGL